MKIFLLFYCRSCSESRPLKHMLDSALCFSNFNSGGNEIAKVKGSELINSVTFPQGSVRKSVCFCFVFILFYLFLFWFCLHPVSCVSNIASVSGLSIFDFSSFYSNVSLVWIYYVLSLEDRLILLWFFIIIIISFHQLWLQLPKRACFTFY